MALSVPADPFPARGESRRQRQATLAPFQQLGCFGGMKVFGVAAQNQYGRKKKS